MILKKLLNKYKNNKNNLLQNIFGTILLVAITFFLITSCNQKFPQAPDMKSNITLDTLDLESEINDTTILEPREDLLYTNSQYLYIGEGTQVNTSSLLKFVIPDSLGNIEGASLKLNFYRQFSYKDSINKKIEAKISQYSDTAWNEESNYKDINENDSRLLGNYPIEKEIVEDSAITVDLEQNVNFKDTVISFLIGSQGKEMIQTIYSKDSNYPTTLVIRTENDTINKHPVADLAKVDYEDDSKKRYNFIPIDISDIASNATVDYAQISLPIEKIEGYRKDVNLGFTDIDSNNYNPENIDSSQVQFFSVGKDTSNNIQVNVTKFLRKRNSEDIDKLQFVVWGENNVLDLGDIYFDGNQNFEMKVETVKHKTTNKN